MLTLIGSSKTRAARPLWLLEELGLPFTHIAVGPRSPEAKAHNPTAKVPVLLVEGVAISDSTAILTYLADSQHRFTHPAGSVARAQQDSLTQFILDEFDANLWTAARHSFILPEDMRLPAIKPTLRWELARSQEFLLERMGEGPFLMGAEMTVPDVILAHCLHWAARIQFPMPEGRLTDYLAMMQARPAYQRMTARG